MAASRLRLNMDKTELIWTGTKHNLSKIPGCGHALTLGAAHVAQSDDVRVLGVQLSSDLSLDKHVSVVSDASPGYLGRRLPCLNLFEIHLVLLRDTHRAIT